MRYPYTVAVLSERIRQHYPDAPVKLEAVNRAAFQRGDYQEGHFPAYLLWMLHELQTFEDAGQAGRWLGWALRSLEILKVTTLQENRDLVRADKKAGAV